MEGRRSGWKATKWLKSWAHIQNYDLISLLFKEKTVGWNRKIRKEKVWEIEVRKAKVWKEAKKHITRKKQWPAEKANK